MSDKGDKHDKGGLFGDDDLLSELDQWDRTFDALHEEGGGVIFSDQVPSPAAGLAPTAPAPPPVAPAPAALIDSDDSLPMVAAAPMLGQVDRALHAVVPTPTPPTPVQARSPRPTPRTTQPTTPPAPHASGPAPSPTALPPRTAARSLPRTTPPRPPRPTPPTPNMQARSEFPQEPEATPVPEPIPTPRGKVKSIPPPPPRKRASSESPFEATGDETDFSDLGFAGEPEALGSLLGTPPPLEPPPDDSGENKPVEAPPRRPSRPPAPVFKPFGNEDAPTKVLPLKPLLRANTLARSPSGQPVAPAPGGDEDDSVFTSAARPPTTPLKLEPAPTDDELFGDLPAQPPQPTATVSSPATEATRVASLDELGKAFDEGDGFSGEPGAGGAGGATRIVDPNSGIIAEVRRAAAQPDGKVAPRTPAVVRRDQIGKGPGKGTGTPRRPGGDFGQDDSAPGGDFGGAGESTRVANFGEIEAMAQKQREEAEAASAAAAAFFAEGGSPEVSLEADGDFYADIEIGGDSEADEPVEGTPGPSRRVTSHLVRRAVVATPSAGVRAPVDDDDDDLSLEISHGDDGDDDVRDRAATTALHRDGDELSMSVEDALDDLDDAVPVPAPAEDDFSDVAAVVGNQVVSQRAGTSPPVGGRAGTSPPVAAAPSAPAPAAKPAPAKAAAKSVLLHDDDESGDEEGIDWWDDDEEGNELPAARSGLLPTPPASAGTTGPVNPQLIAAAREHVEREQKLKEAAREKSQPGVAPAAPRPGTTTGAPTMLGIAPGPRPATTPPPAQLEREPAGLESKGDISTRASIGGLPSLRPAPATTPPPVAPSAAPTLIEAAPDAVAPSAAPTLVEAAPPAPARPELEPVAVESKRPALPDVAPELPPSRFAEPNLALDLDAVSLPERVDPTAGIDLGEAAAQSLLVYERELESVDDVAALAALRAEAGRLSERLGDLDRARAHYEAALLADPRSTQSLRGLRRIARAGADLAEATQHLDAELAVAGPLERRALALHRVDLLMAAGEQDLARVAVGELLDGAPGDVRALLAQLELSFLDGRADEFGESLDRLAGALADAPLRAAVEVARGHLDERAGGDPDRAARAFTAAADSDPASIGARLGQARIAAGRGDLPGYVASRGQLAIQVGAADPVTGASIALRASHRAVSHIAHDLEAQALAVAQQLAPADELVLVGLAGSGTRRADDATAGAAWRDLAGVASNPADRAAAAVRSAAAHQAAGDGASASILYQIAAELDAEDDHAAAALERLLAEQGDLAGAAHALARRLGADPGHQRDRIALARLIAGSEPMAPSEEVPAPPLPIDTALALLSEGRTLAPGAPALVDAAADLLGAAGRWRERAELLGQVATLDSPDVDSELGSLRAALAFDDAVAAAATAGAAAAAAQADQVTRGSSDDSPRAIAAALEAWTKVLDFDSESGRAHGAALALARALGDRDVAADVLQRAQAATRHAATATTFALARARAFAAPLAPVVGPDGAVIRGGAEPDLARADDVLREDGPLASVDDVRKTVLATVLAARAGRWGDAALALEERAEVASAVEALSLRFRAAQLHLDKGDDAGRAAQLLAEVAAAQPGFAAAGDLLGNARRRLGDAAASSAPPAPRHAADVGLSGTSAGDAFARLVREADLAAAQDDGNGAVLLYSKALELRPGDPLAAEPLARVAAAAVEPAPVAALALAELKRAEESGDVAARADAYETLARVDAELRRDTGSALISWEAAAEADPTRHYVLRRLERAYAAESRWSDLSRVREKEMQALAATSGDPSRAVTATSPDGPAPDDSTADLVALGLDRAILAERDGRPDEELRAAYEDVVARDPRRRLALFHLESNVRRAGSSPDLARLELLIADFYADEPRARAAFLTRAGETLADLGEIDRAIETLRAADAARPGYVSALHAWRAAALKGQLWIDVAEAATREADATSDTDAEKKANLHHLAGVAYMDKALVGDRAAIALRKAIAANPRHKDAFVRLRMLLDEQGDYEDLAQLLAARVDVEDDAAARTELHRASAELFRNFLGDRDTAKKHYRAILDADPADLRAIAALSDICWEQGSWAECADTLMNRARLEREPDVLRGIFRRLGTIYAGHLPDPQHAIKAFQRVLSYDPEDREALERLADLGIATGEWKMALGACERLVRTETDANKKASHLHRVGRIFQAGFGDRKKAERAYIMALDAAPENDAALTELVRFYQDSGDIQSARIHLRRVAGGMRARTQNDPSDGVAYRVIARAMAALEGANVRGSLVVARAAAEMARLTGGAEAPEDALAMAAPPPVSPAVLTRPEADELLFPRTVPPELRQIFTLLGDRVAKHVGVDLRPYGVTRGDRLRRTDSPVAAAAQEVAEALGLGEIDVYLSARAPTVMVAEPTSPVSLVLGNAIASDAQQVRFAAGAALKLAQAQLAIPARLAPDDLGVMVIALLRLFIPDTPYLALDNDAIAAQGQKLRRLIPNNLMNELKPFALGMNTVGFDHRALARGIASAGWRAGVVAAGSIAAPLRVLAARMQVPDVPSVLADPAIRELVQFAIGEDYATIAAL